MALPPDISELSGGNYSPQQTLVCGLNCPWNDAVVVEDKSVRALTVGGAEMRAGKVGWLQTGDV